VTLTMKEQHKLKMGVDYASGKVVSNKSIAAAA
jgi:hypothetical protein